MYYLCACWYSTYTRRCRHNIHARNDLCLDVCHSHVRLTCQCSFGTWFSLTYFWVSVSVYLHLCVCAFCDCVI